MGRVNIYYADDDEFGTGERTLIGWFNPDTAASFNESTTWDGNNHISDATGSQYDHQMLYRTAGGRWVLHGYSQWQGRTETYEFVNDDRAREWLISQHQDEAVEQFFGDISDESGPNAVGRPEVGGTVNVRLGELLAEVDAVADREDRSRAAMIRTLLGEALAARKAAAQ